MRALSAHVSRVQATRDADIGRSFDDHATIRENRHFIRLGEKPEGKFVRPDAAQWFELDAQPRQIEGSRSLVNLNGVPSTEADRGAPRRLEVRVFVPPTRAASGVFVGLADLTDNSAPDVNRRDPARGRNTDQESWSPRHTAWRRRSL